MLVYVRSFDYHHKGKVIKSYNRHEVNRILEVNKYNILELKDGTTMKVSIDMVELKLPKDSYDVTNLEVLPLYADLIEDVPAYVKFKPKKYHRAQVLVKDKLSCGNLNHMFYKHIDSSKPLMIAINSHSIINSY